MGADRSGAIAHGASLAAGSSAAGGSAGGVLSFGLDPRREPPPVCPAGRGGLLSVAGAGLEKISAGDGLLGQSEQGGGEGVAAVGATALRTLTGGRRAREEGRIDGAGDPLPGEQGGGPPLLEGRAG